MYQKFKLNTKITILSKWSLQKYKRLYFHPQVVNFPEIFQPYVPEVNTIGYIFKESGEVSPWTENKYADTGL